MFTVYMSGSRKDYTLGTNAIRTRQARVMAEEITGQHADPLIGMFEGVVEHSFRVKADEQHLNELVKLCKAFDQDCLMLVDEHRRVYFIGSAIDLRLALFHGPDRAAGFLRQYGASMPGGVAAWSYDGRHYYIVTELA